MTVFFSDQDREEYVRLLAEQSRRFGVRYVAWCLMTNHVHLIAVPDAESSLALGIGEAHRRYTRFINFREGCRGYLFQGRFYSCPLDGTSLLTTLRYVLRNPVRAGAVDQAWEYRWSSARWHVGCVASDPLAQPSQLLEEVEDWKAFLREDEPSADRIRKHTSTGRPLGSESFLAQLEETTGRVLRPAKRGPKPRS
jgi:putative transposase